MVSMGHVFALVSILLVASSEGQPDRESPLNIPGITIVPLGRGSGIEIDKSRLFGGNALNSMATAFEDDPQQDCLEVAGLFSVTPHGFSIILPARRDQLRFEAQEELDTAKEAKIIRFVTASCRLNVVVEKLVKDDDSWVPLSPTE
jgi:hypothetical protein